MKSSTRPTTMKPSRQATSRAKSGADSKATKQTSRSRPSRPSTLLQKAQSERNLFASCGTVLSRRVMTKAPADYDANKQTSRLRRPSRPLTLPRKANSERNIFASHIMPPPLSSDDHDHHRPCPNMNDKKPDSIRQNRRNSITMYNLNGTKNVTYDQDQEYELSVLRQQAQSCHDRCVRSDQCWISPLSQNKTVTSKSYRHRRSVDRTAMFDRNLHR
jgi:hypothetical protein